MKTPNRTLTFEQMRGMTSRERLAFIMDHVDENQVVWLQIAAGASLSRIDMETIFSEGVRRGEVSQCRWWFEASVPVIGPRRALELLRECARAEPANVARVMYYASGEIMRQDASLRRELEEISKVVGKP